MKNKEKQSKGSLAKVSRKLAKNNSFIAEFEESLKGVNRQRLKNKALNLIKNHKEEVLKGCGEKIPCYKAGFFICGKKTDISESVYHCPSCQEIIDKYEEVGL